MSRPSARACLLAGAAFCLLPGGLAAQTTAPEPFALGEIIVTGTAPEAPVNWPSSVDRVDRRSMDALDANRVGQALEAAPGLSLNPGNRGGARGEVGFFLRGFDQSRVPVLVDGIPIYVPYDGYLDLNRVLTSDLAEIEITRGFAPFALGPNALGGAVNLVTRRPVRPFEFDASTGLDITGRGDFGGSRTILNAGSRIGDYYVQGGAAYIGRETFGLSEDFGGGLYQPSGNRLRAESEDLRLSGKVGYTPSATDEYAIGFVVNRGVKEAPPYAGQDATRATFFDWPRYDRDSFYALTRTGLPIGTDSYIRTRAYYDTFRNSLYRYDNQTYTTQRLPYAFQSSYNDHTLGGGVELGTSPTAGGTLRLSATTKQDVHRESGPRTPESEMSDFTWTLGLDAEQRVNSWLTFFGGVGYEVRDALRAEDPAYNGARRFETRDQDALNGQIGMRIRLDDTNEVFTSIARRSRFATMYERYSYRLGNGLPNPDLAPERSTNVELGWDTRVTPDTRLRIAAFGSQVDDYIQATTVGRATTAPFGLITQSRNVGEALFYGVEASVETRLTERARLRLNYTYLVRERGNDDTALLYGAPRHKLFALGFLDITERLTLMPSVLAQSRQFTTDAGNGRPTGGWLVGNVKLAYAFTPRLSGEVAANNITDADYSYDDGYPAEGRNFRFTLRSSF
ncbi:TonB-dependent receptor plug domain-containing protein [Roseomonas sp. F4]